MIRRNSCLNISISNYQTISFLGIHKIHMEKIQDQNKVALELENGNSWANLTAIFRGFISFYTLGSGCFIIIIISEPPISQFYHHRKNSQAWGRTGASCSLSQDICWDTCGTQSPRPNCLSPMGKAEIQEKEKWISYHWAMNIIIRGMPLAKNIPHHKYTPRHELIPCRYIFAQCCRHRGDQL